MSVIAEFTVKADDFALYHSLTTAPEMIVEIERVVATMEDRVMPYFWVHGGDHQEFENAFRDDESVTNITTIDAVDDAKLYRAEWTQHVESIVYAYVEIGATILQAVGRDELWELRIRFDDHDSLSEFQSYCEENGSASNSIVSQSKNSQWPVRNTISLPSNVKPLWLRSTQATTRYHKTLQ